MSKKYQKIDPLTQVAEFHKTFNAPLLDTAAIPNKARSDLRVSLLQEELDELKEAIDDESIVGIADALCDLQYVLAGAVLEFGLGDLFPQLFAEVHRSNMSKACATIKEAIETQDYYMIKNGIGTYIKEQDDGTWVVYRTEDNKTLKSINYSPANLEKILNEPTIISSDDHLGILEKAALPLMEYIATNHDPHTIVTVSNNRAELLKGVRAVVNNKFIE